jgi:hypothetical protein
MGYVNFIQDYIPMYQSQFDQNQSGGLVNGAAAFGVLSSSGLAKAQLKKIWDLGDINKDGALDLYEFVIVMHLVDYVKQGNAVPDSLDPSMIPPNRK